MFLKQSSYIERQIFYSTTQSGFVNTRNRIPHRFFKHKVMDYIIIFCSPFAFLLRFSNAQPTSYYITSNGLFHLRICASPGLKLLTNVGWPSHLPLYFRHHTKLFWQSCHWNIPEEQGWRKQLHQEGSSSRIFHVTNWIQIYKAYG